MDDAERDLLSDDEDREVADPPLKQPSAPRAIVCMIALAVVAIVVASAGGFAAGTTYNQAHAGITTAIAHITLSANTSVDVCTDPWAYACGGYEARHQEYNTITDYQRYLNHRIAKKFDGTTDHGRFYLACRDAPPSPPLNVSGMWLLTRGFRFANVSVGWGTNPMNNQETVAYIENASSVYSGIPISADASSGNECDAAIVSFVRKVTRNTYATTVLLYGEQAELCSFVRGSDFQLASEPRPQLAATESACLAYTEKLWPNRLAATVWSATDSAVMSKPIMALCREIQAHFAAMLADQLHATAARKVSLVKCRVEYSGPAEMYAVNWSNPVDTVYFNLRHQQFQREIAQTSLATVWDMSALSVNAAYSSIFNELYITPAMAMFTRESSDTRALMLARVGFVLAHELAHALDPSGIYFDATGMYTPASILPPRELQELERASACVVDEFGTYGRTVQEDVADHLAAAVVVSMVREQPSSGPVRICAPVCTSLTMQAQYYMYFAQTWCSSEQSQLRAVNSLDVHSPNKKRVEHALANSNAAAVFGCPPTPRPCDVYGL